MTKGVSAELPDSLHRRNAIEQRAHNLVLDAGAGTGKTSILVRRAIEMLAPEDDGPAYPLARLGILTFTRKAAGELRIRLRESLLAKLGEADISDLRRGRLSQALDQIDLAFVGTIHSFADRLLRLRPVEAQISPIYQIAEDTGHLEDETAALLIEGAQTGALPKLLADTDALHLAKEATQAILGALLGGIRREDLEFEWGARYGLSGLVRSFIDARDVPVELPDVRDFDHESYREAALEFILASRDISNASTGGRWLSTRAQLLRAHLDERDPVRLRQALVRHLRGGPPTSASKPRLRVEFGNDKVAWALWQAFTDGKKRDSGLSLRDEILGPLDAWLAPRLARLAPVVIALYEKVKAEHGVVDQIDLLLKLRDLLASDLEARAYYQRLFDHIFIDEFQDTDPLQAEVVMYLCEDGAQARDFADIKPARGKLTLVGDPKQSIYRFRRADIAMYERVRAMVVSHEHISASLSTNFRSKPSLIDWYNQHFEKILGKAGEGEPIFNAQMGTVAYQPLAAGRRDDDKASVHILAFEVDEDSGKKSDDYRRAEGEALAHYLRWLVEKSGTTIQDPKSFEERPVRYGDISILVGSTYTLRFLFPRLNEMGIPHSIRGGKLFLSEPLHRQFLLAMGALADRRDGVAHASLLRPPFFAIDPADLAAERSADTGDETNDPRVLRVREAKALVTELRKTRFDRSPGATMRKLLEESAMLRRAALGQNGAQRIERLYELCFYADTMAASEQLDFDQTAERLRELALNPAQLDPPHAVGGDAVSVLTMHQSKGLEFPVTVLWDGRASWSVRAGGAPWRVDREGKAWAISLDGLSWGEPSGAKQLSEEDNRYAAAEKRRVIYVGATRARDLLVVPKAGAPNEKSHIAAQLLGGGERVHELELYTEGKGAPWAEGIEPGPSFAMGEVLDLDKEISAKWQRELGRAKEPKLAPTAISKDADEVTGGGQRRGRKSRHGRDFGNVVHRALELALLGLEASAEEAVHRAARETGFNEKIEEAIDDTKRALDTLRREGLVRSRESMRIEYPIAGASSDRAKLFVGSADFIALRDGAIDILDFKTDPAPLEPVESEYPAYVEQVRRYGEILSSSQGGPKLGRVGLLFTEDGKIRWCNPST